MRRWFASNQAEDLFKDTNKIEIGEVRTSPYNIRLPLRTEDSSTIKLEFVAENRFELLDSEKNIIPGLPMLHLCDRFTSKLLANADRGMDSSTYCRDLIDLSILRQEMPIPKDAIARAEANYPVVKPLIEVLSQFKAKPELRESCYKALLIDNPIKVIDGLNLILADYELPKIKRSFIETDFSYLDEEPTRKPQKSKAKKSSKSKDLEL